MLLDPKINFVNVGTNSVEIELFFDGCIHNPGESGGWYPIEIESQFDLIKKYSLLFYKERN